jgi:hypothetical protein
MRVDVTEEFTWSRKCFFNMIINSTNEVIKMNMPGFTAEATLYNSVTPYRSSRFIHTEIGLNVIPQIGFTSKWMEMNFIGEWMARLSSDAAFFSGGSSGGSGSSPADIAERKLCLGLRRSCANGDKKACRLLAEEC